MYTIVTLRSKGSLLLYGPIFQGDFINLQLLSMDAHGDKFSNYQTYAPAPSPQISTLKVVYTLLALNL